MQRKLTFVINTSELGAGTRGASLGPDAIMAAARKQKSRFFAEFPLLRLPDPNALLDQETPYRFARQIDGVVEVYRNMESSISKVLQQGDFPFVIAGDHGSAGGTIAGIKAAYPDKRLGVIWIDAHADLHSPYTTPSGNIHGMPLATALGEDNLPCQSNHPDEQSIALWNQLKGNKEPRVHPQDLVFIAVRDTEEQEDALMNRLQIPNYTVSEVRNIGAKHIANAALDYLKHCDILYVSFDVDSMDPDLTSHGTGTPVAGGLTVEEALDLLQAFARAPQLVCLELVEVNPCLDEKTNTMAETAFHLIQSVSSSLTN